jgi:hypothetical protein
MRRLKQRRSHHGIAHSADPTIDIGFTRLIFFPYYA